MAENPQVNILDVLVESIATTDSHDRLQQTITEAVTIEKTPEGVIQSIEIGFTDRRQYIRIERDRITLHGSIYFSTESGQISAEDLNRMVSMFFREKSN